MPSAKFASRKLQQKQHTSAFAPGQQFNVDVQQIDDSPIVWEVTVSDGVNPPLVERHTVGNANGTGPVLTLAQVAADLANYRQMTTDRFAWGVQAKTLSAQMT